MRSIRGKSSAFFSGGFPVSFLYLAIGFKIPSVVYILGSISEFRVDTGNIPDIIHVVVILFHWFVASAIRPHIGHKFVYMPNTVLSYHQFNKLGFLILGRGKHLLDALDARKYIIILLWKTTAYPMICKQPPLIGSL